jgi:hypothetical protein
VSVAARIPAGKKNPALPRWQHLRLGLDELERAFRPDGPRVNVRVRANIGMPLGAPSGG